MDTTKITILLFGVAKEIVKSPTLVLPINEGENIHSLKERLTEAYPQFSKLKSLMIAVNQKYVDGGYEIQRGDEIAIIPPVSGG